jgi:hypothetical protein
MHPEHHLCKITFAFHHHSYLHSIRHSRFQPQIAYHVFFLHSSYTGRLGYMLANCNGRLAFTSPRSPIDRHRRFEGIYWLHLQKALGPSETLLPIYQTALRHILEGSNFYFFIPEFLRLEQWTKTSWSRHNKYLDFVNSLRIYIYIYIYMAIQQQTWWFTILHFIFWSPYRVCYLFSHSLFLTQLPAPRPSVCRDLKAVCGQHPHLFSETPTGRLVAWLDAPQSAT